MKIDAKCIQIGILAFCVQSSVLAVTTAEVMLDVLACYGTLAKDFLANNSEELFVLAGGKLKTSMPPEQVELSFGALKKGIVSVVGGVSSLSRILQLKDRQMLFGGAALGTLAAYIAYLLHENSEQIEEVHREVLSNGEKIDKAQETLNVTRIEIAQGFVRTETSITSAKEDLQKRIAALHAFVQKKLQQQNKVTLQQHQMALRQFQQIKNRLTQVADQQDVQYNGLSAQLSTLENMLTQYSSETLALIDCKFNEKFTSSEKRTQTYVNQKFNQIEQNQEKMMKLLTHRDISSSGLSCQGRALRDVSSK